MQRDVLERVESILTLMVGAGGVDVARDSSGSKLCFGGMVRLVNCLEVDY